MYKGKVCSTHLTFLLDLFAAVTKLTCAADETSTIRGYITSATQAVTNLQNTFDFFCRFIVRSGSQHQYAEAQNMNGRAALC